MSTYTFLPFVPPAVSLSAPASILPSRIATPKSPRGKAPLRDWNSLPSSPIAKKGALSPIAKKKLPLLPPSNSPKAYLRKHKYHVTFATAARTAASDAYQGPRVHAYRGPRTLEPIGAATMGKDESTPSLPNLCPVHSYADPSTTLKRTGMSAFGKEVSERNAILSEGPSIHSYADPTTTLKRTGVGAFDRSAVLRNEHPACGPALHAYAAERSTLRRTGAAAFGSTAVGRGDLHTISRTGLLSATVTPRDTPKPRELPSKKPLPKLVPPTVRAASPTSVEDPLNHAPAALEPLTEEGADDVPETPTTALRKASAKPFRLDEVLGGQLSGAPSSDVAQSRGRYRRSERRLEAGYDMVEVA